MDCLYRFLYRQSQQYRRNDLHCVSRQERNNAQGKRRAEGIAGMKHENRRSDRVKDQCPCGHHQGMEPPAGFFPLFSAHTGKESTGQVTRQVAARDVEFAGYEF